MAPEADSSPATALELAKHGIAMREAGDHAGAVTIFQRLIDHWPGLVYGWQEMAVLNARSGQDVAALDLFARAAEVDPQDFLTRRHLVRHLLHMERCDEARIALQAHVPTSEPMREDLAVLGEFVEIVRRFPRSWALSVLDRVVHGGTFLPPEDVSRRILQAVAARTPFSLIRLGDGEGAWLSLGAEDEANFGRLYAANRRKFLRVWFGAALEEPSPAFLATRRHLARALERADIVGVPFGLRVAHEYEAFSYAGVAGCINVIRWLRLGDAAQLTRNCCSQDVHRELHEQGFFPKLFAMPIQIGVVTCHPDLGIRLIRGFGARVVSVVLVPEEQGFTEMIEGLSAITGVSGITEPHFPGWFQRTEQRLQAEAGRAAVWLVAAGYLGKLYCDTLRESGAVALDVGSLVDGWCGAVTRPYLSAVQDFQVC
jgi:GT-D fold-like domain